MKGEINPVQVTGTKNPQQAQQIGQTSGIAHGTYSSYTVNRCRCAECRRANTLYERRRTRLKAEGRFPWRGPEPSRRRLGERLGQGCPLRSISRETGIARSRLQEILHGKHDVHGDLVAVTRVHEQTECRLLLLDPARARDPGKVGGKNTWLQIQELIDFGIPKSRIALALGKQSPALQLSPTTVSTKNARQVDDLHWTLWKNHAPFRSRCSCSLPADILRLLEDTDA